MTTPLIRRCRHGRTGTCAYCAARIRADHYYEMMRFRAELRRQGKRRRPPSPTAPATPAP